MIHKYANFTGSHKERSSTECAAYSQRIPGIQHSCFQYHYSEWLPLSCWYKTHPLSWGIEEDEQFTFFTLTLFDFLAVVGSPVGSFDCDVSPSKSILGNLRASFFDLSLFSFLDAATSGFTLGLFLPRAFFAKECLMERRRSDGFGEKPMSKARAGLLLCWREYRSLSKVCLTMAGLLQPLIDSKG